MKTISSVQVPAYEFHFNLVVYPLPTSERKVRKLKYYFCPLSYSLFIQGFSHFYVLRDNCVEPKATGGSHWLEFLPDHVYCFLPSDFSKGIVHVFDHVPDCVTDFLYSMEIDPVRYFKQNRQSLKFKIFNREQQ